MLQGGDKLVCKNKNIKEIDLICFDLNILHRISKIQNIQTQVLTTYEVLTLRYGFHTISIS